MLNKLLDDRAFWDRHATEISAAIIDHCTVSTKTCNVNNSAELCIQRMRSDIALMIYDHKKDGK